MEVEDEKLTGNLKKKVKTDYFPEDDMVIVSTDFSKNFTLE